MQPSSFILRFNMVRFFYFSSKPHHFMASSAGIGPATHSLEGYCSIHWTTRMKPWRLPLIWSHFEQCNGRCPKMVLEMSGAAPDFLKSLNRADSSHACRHSFLADDDLNPFLSSRTARIRHPWIGAYLNFHLFDGWRHAIPRLSELSLCLTTYPNSGFFRWHRSQTRLRVRTVRSQLFLVDFVKKPFDRLLHASTVSTPSRS